MSKFVNNDHQTNTSANSVTGQCRHIKGDGSQCKAYAVRESFYCFIHNPDLKEQREAAQKKGGKERSRKAPVLPAGTPDRPLATAEDVEQFLGETINQVRRGELDHRISNSIGCLVGYLLKAQEQGQLERRLAKMESIAGQKWANLNITSVPTSESTTFEFVKVPGGEA